MTKKTLMSYKVILSITMAIFKEQKFRFEINVYYLFISSSMQYDAIDSQIVLFVQQNIQSV
jgi:hypothetical protein